MKARQHYTSPKPSSGPSGDLCGITQDGSRRNQKSPRLALLSFKVQNINQRGSLDALGSSGCPSQLYSGHPHLFSLHA